MLQIDPAKRATMREVVNHKWMKIGGEDPVFDNLIEESLTKPLSHTGQLNDIVLQHMESLGIERDKTIDVRKMTIDVRETFLFSV